MEINSKTHSYDAMTSPRNSQDISFGHLWSCGIDLDAAASSSQRRNAKNDTGPLSESRLQGPVATSEQPKSPSSRLRSRRNLERSSVHGMR